MDRSKCALLAIHQWKNNYNFYRLFRTCIELGHATESEAEEFFGVRLQKEFLSFKIVSSLSQSNKTLSNMMFDAQFGTVKWIDVHAFIVKNGFKIKAGGRGEELSKVRQETKQNLATIANNTNNNYNRKLYNKVGGSVKRNRFARV